MQFRGLDHFEQTVRTTGRRLGLGLAAGAAIVSTAVVAASPNGTTLVTTAMGFLALLLGTALVVDIVRGADDRRARSSWFYRTVLSVCMGLIAWAIDRKLRQGRRET